MSEEEKQEDVRNPTDTGPFKIGHLIGRNKVEVHPDPTLIKTMVISSRDTLAVKFRDWFLNHNIHYYMFYFVCIVAGYEIPATYYPGVTNIVFGVIFGTLIGTAPLAYEYEAHRDKKEHTVFVNEVQIELSETPVGRIKSKEGTKRLIVKGKITRQSLYMARDYQFNGNSEYSIDVRDYQTIDNGIGLGKIINATLVDASGRIIIGDTKSPTGLIVATAFPSRSQMSEKLKTIERRVKSGEVKYEDFMKVKKANDALRNVEAYMIKTIDKAGIVGLDMDSLPKKIKNYYIALNKLSIPWFTKSKQALSGADWENMDPSIRLPKVMQMWQAYEDTNNEVVDLMLTREGDKLEALAESTLNLAELTGLTNTTIQQAIAETNKKLISVERKEEKDIEEAITGDRGEEEADNRQ